MSKRVSTEGFSAEQALGDDPFSAKRLRLLQALADAMFADPPDNAAARHEPDELIASCAQLFFPGLPQEAAQTGSWMSWLPEYAPSVPMSPRRGYARS